MKNEENIKHTYSFLNRGETYFCGVKTDTNNPPVDWKLSTCDKCIKFLLDNKEKYSGKHPDDLKDIKYIQKRIYNKDFKQLLGETK